MALRERTAPRAAPAPLRGEAGELDRLVDRIMRAAVAAAVAGAVVQTAAQLLNYFVFDFEVWNLNVDADGNAFSWASSVAQFGAAFGCALLAAAGWWAPRRLWVIAAVLAFFSLDDIVRIHEEVGYRFREDVLGLELGWGRLIWPVLFLPLLAAAFILLWQFAERAPMRAARGVRIGLAMLVLAVLAEASSTVFHLGEDPEGTLTDILQVAVEESLELAGWLLIAGGIASTLLVALARQERPAP